MDAVEEIKQRLNIEDVIGEYVQLKRAGRNYKGLSPFSNERTPSFMVSPEKQIWHDFSSGKGGNVFSFIMEVEGLEFKGALELLARKAGVDLEQYRRSGPSGYNAKLKERFSQALALAVKFYQTQLSANPPALHYVRDARGMSKETLLAWKIGYSPNQGRALSTFLTKQGFTTDEMKRAGLVTERRHGLGDMFRGRIMIPLCDAQGQPVGFTARLLADDPEAPKYINTPQTILYDKGRQVFGLHLAKEQIRKRGFVVIVEGNLDVISSYQADVPNVVATAGTAMTEMHLKALNRFTGDIRLCFDGDEAGLKATERAVQIAQKVGVQLSIISLGTAKDPDELIQKDPDAWRAAILKPTYAVDWLIERYAALHNLTTANGKRQFSDTVLATVRMLQDPIEQEHYIKRIAELTDTSLEAVKSKLHASPVAAQRAKRIKQQPLKADPRILELQRLQDHFLAIVLMQPALRSELDDVEAAWFNGDQLKLLAFLKAHPDFGGDPNQAKGLQAIADYVKIVGLQFEELYGGLSREDLHSQLTSLKHRLIQSYVKTQKHMLAQKMQSTTDESELNRLMLEVNQLNNLIK